VDAELGLVIPVIERWAKEITPPVSVDTYKPKIALRALEAEVKMINGIWSLQKSPELARLAAEAGVPIVLMSNQRELLVEDIMPAVIADPKRAIDTTLTNGITENNIILDPGLGFCKTLEQNLEIVRRLTELKVLRKPILPGSSRKSMIGKVLDLPTDQRVEGTAATVAIGIANGADIVRVHDVKEMMRVSRMSNAIMRGRP
jgi:dihydropteroate synthase